jgi:hypothetical protein
VAQRRRTNQPRIHRNTPAPNGNVVFEQCLIRERLGRDIAAAMNLRRVVAKAEQLEKTNELERARHTYLSAAAGALARAELVDELLAAESAGPRGAESGP